MAVLLVSPMVVWKVALMVPLSAALMAALTAEPKVAAWDDQTVAAMVSCSAEKKVAQKVCYSAALSAYY